MIRDLPLRRYPRPHPRPRRLPRHRRPVPDGSAKFAIVAGTAPLTAGVATTIGMSAGPASSGIALTLATLQAAMTQPVTVACGSFGTASWSGGDWASPFQTWIIGHRMSSWIYRKPVGNDAHVVAWLEVRLWDNGEVEVLPWIENGYLLVPGATSKGATYTFTLGGTVRFSASIDIPHHCSAVLLDSAATSHWLGAARDVIVKHDVAYLQSTGLVPSYTARTPSNVQAVVGLPATFRPMQQGNWPTGMGAGGYSPSIGLIPEWDALYVTSDAPATYKGVVFNAYSSGRYGLRYRDETNTAQPHRPPRLSLHPTLQVTPPQAGYETTPAATGTAGPNFSTSHQPSTCFVAYLITGRWYFMDQLQFVAALNALFDPSGRRDGGLSVFKSTTVGATRHVAWCLRTLAQAITATPDSDAVFLGEFRTQFANNINYYHARYIAQPHNPFGFVTPYVDYSRVTAIAAAGCTTTKIVCTPGNLGGAPYNNTVSGQYVGQDIGVGGELRVVTEYDATTETLTVAPPFSVAPPAGVFVGLDDHKTFDSLWMSDFFNAVLGYAKDLEVGLDTATQAKFDEFYAWKARSTIGRLGTTAATDFLFRDYAEYAIAVAPFTSPNGIPENDARWNTGAGPWYANWGEIYAATFSAATPPGGTHSFPGYASPGPKVDGPIRCYLNPEFPAAEALPALAYAVRHGLAGAAAAYRRLTSASNWAAFARELDAQPVWAVSPAVVALPATPGPSSPPPGTVPA